MKTEPCPGCRAELPTFDGPTHRYIGASAGCWDVYTRALADDPPLGSGQGVPLVVDAYAAQHPGDGSPQATQSVAVHIVVLHAATHHGVGAGELVRLRTRIVEWGRRQGGLPRLLPVPARWDLTIHDVVAAAPPIRPGLAQDYADSVLAAWEGEHRDRIVGWYRAVVSV